MTAPPPFTLSIDRQGTTAVVVVEGDFDLHAVPAVTSEVAHLLATGVTRIEIDAAAVAFADSSALRTLLVSQDAATAAGATLCVSAASDAVNLVMDMTGLGQVLGPCA
jgi:anti-anti-sigma factor